jgi:hypothetical protein
MNTMNIGFIDEKRIWAVPDAALIALAAKLRRATDRSIDPVTKQTIEAWRAHDLAVDIEVGVETGAVTHLMDDRDRPAFCWALQAWTTDQRSEPPDWAIELCVALQSVETDAAFESGNKR